VSARKWLESAAKTQVEHAVAAAEQITSAEFVVTVRHRSGAYHAAALAFGGVCSFAGLLLYVYHPTEFTDDLVPPALLLLFVLSAALASQVGLLLRLLTPAGVRRENVRRAAIEAFHEQGISVTQGRTGVLLYVSLLELSATVIADVGVDLETLDEGGKRAIAEIEGAVRHGGVDALVNGLGRLSRSLGRTLPRSADDENELSDAVVS
jgi:putative membrane protein